MAWIRLGRLFAPDGTRPWARSHASLPVSVHLGADDFRIFFSTRDTENRSSVGWVDINLSGQPKVTGVCDTPVLEFGTPGYFDDSGIGIGSIVHCDGEDLLYYMGWNLAVRAPWRNSIGIASGSVRTPRFQRLFEGPIMDRCPEDPFTLSYPWVIRFGASDWRMWYGSNLRWGSESADMQHVIKCAESADGLVWKRHSEPAVDFSTPAEYALARPSVLPGGDVLRMWFSTRGDRYRIGAALSEDDGRRWHRCDSEFGLIPANRGWDDEMVCYPCIFRHRGMTYMLYNGNGYGATGFGLAVWEGLPL